MTQLSLLEQENYRQKFIFSVDNFLSEFGDNTIKKEVKEMSTLWPSRYISWKLKCVVDGKKLFLVRRR